MPLFEDRPHLESQEPLGQHAGALLLASGAWERCEDVGIDGTCGNCFPQSFQAFPKS